MDHQTRFAVWRPALGATLVGLLLAIIWIVATPRYSGSREAPPLSPTADAPVTVVAQPLPVAPGGILFVKILAPEAASVHLFDGKRTYDAYRGPDGAWEVAIGIERNATPGARTLTARAAIGDASATAAASFRIAPRTFGVQHLRMSRSEEAKYSRASVQNEYRLIGAAKNQETPERAWRGAFDLPTDGRLSTAFGIQRYRNGQKVSIHKGIDLAAPRGRLVYAANAGTVVLRRAFGMHGHTIVIDHGGGVAGLYLHLNEFGVSEGQRVEQGQKIGRVGSTGVATGPHLHYALYVHGVPVDPLLWRDAPAGW